MPKKSEKISRQNRSKNSRGLSLNKKSINAILDNFPEVMYIVDPLTYEVVYINKTFKNMLGNDPAGGLCYKEIQDFDEPCSFCTNDIILETRKPYIWEFHNKHIDRHFLITDQIIEWEDGRDVRYEIAVDITERKKAEEELERMKNNLENLVEERTVELQQKTGEILELSTPIMQIWDKVIVAPLIGTLDSQRTQQFTEHLLKRVVTTDSQVALIDITGVPVVDTQSAQHLIETIAAVKLLGSQVVLTGVRPVIAQTLVHLGIDLSQVSTKPSLAAGLKDAFEILRLEIK